MTTPSPSRFAARPRNRRGEGDRLREDIVTAAASMLAESGDAHQVTLRGVAKKIGISAPSIYRHFPDVEHLTMAVVERAFTTFAAARDRAGRQAASPAARLLARCRAYCQFAIDHPGEYRFMFSPDAPTADADSDRPPVQMAVFRALADSIRACQEAGLAAAADSPDWLAAEIWAALHGLVLLRLNAPSFPWPAPLHEMADQVVSRILILDDGNCRDHRPGPGR
jgi:AcrR family transcriptional regulator